MKIRILFTFLASLYIHTGLFSDDNNFRVDGLSEPSTYIHGCVNAITGSFVYSFPDMSVDGPETLNFIRHYSSMNHSNCGFGQGFSHNYPTGVLHGKVGKHYRSITLNESFGGELRFLCRYSKNDQHQLYLEIDQFEHGLTNCCGHILSGKSNPKNTWISLKTQKKDRWNEGEVYVHYGDGGLKYYGKRSILQYQLLPSGNYIKYNYKDGRISRIYSTDASQSIVFNWIDFHYDGHYNVKLTGSNGVSASYTLKKHDKNKKITLRSCKSTGIPESEITYHDWMEKIEVEKEENYDPFKEEEPDYVYRGKDYKKIYHSVIKRIRFKNQGYLHLEYDHDGKVKKIYSESSNRSGETLYSIDYHPRHSYTAATDALNGTTRYYYTKNNQLGCISHYSGKEEYRNYFYSWGDIKSNDKGNLLAKSIIGTDHQKVCSIEYQYDTEGNVICETLRGDLSGNSNIQETYCRRFTYSQDGFNLPLNVKEDDGTEIHYQYLPGTNKILSKLDLANNHVFKREFFEYNSFKIPITHIVDDGSGHHSNDFTDVTQRLFTRHIINSTPGTDGFCKPIAIVKSYWEPRTQNEIQLSRIDYQYGKFDLINREDHYDANNTFIYSHHYEYDDQRNCIREIDKEGKETIFRYDQSNQCIYKKTIGAGFEVHYTYDSRQRLIKTTEKHESGEEFAVSTAYNLMNLPVKQTDQFGNETQFNYDPFGRLIEKILPTQCTENGELKRPNIRYQYNILNQIKAEINPDNYEIKKNYNIKGQVTDIYFPDGSTEHIRYHSNGKPYKKTLKNGTYLIIQYDAQQRPVAEHTYSSSGVLLRSMQFEYRGANIVKEFDYMGQCKEYEYDGAGRKIAQITHGNGIAYREEYYYDPSGRHNITKCWSDSENNDPIFEIKEFNLNDRVVEERVEDLLGNICSKKQYDYDFNGNCILDAIYSSDHISSIEWREFTSFNKIRKKIDTLGETTHYHYDFKQSNEHNQKVLKTTVTDPKGIQTITTHDPYHRPVTIKQQNTFNLTLSREAISYNLRGNKTLHRTFVMADGIELRQYDVYWTYDSMNRVLCTTEDRKGKNKITSFVYNRVGNIIAKINPDGVTLNYDYDEFDRESRLTSSDGTVCYDYRYNLNDQLIESIDCITGSILRREYDEFGNLNKEIFPNRAEIRYCYDGLKRITEVGLPDGSLINYQYSKNELQSVSKFSRERLHLYTHQYIETDWQGKSLKSLMINGESCSFNWDIHGRYHGVKSKHLSLVIPEDGYDSNGNLLKINYEGIWGSLEEKYNYDDHDQLIYENGLVTHQYRNDSLRNRISKDNLTSKINTLNQIESDGSTDYAYDYNGNLTSEENENGKILYQYDALNRLCSVEKIRKWMVKSAYDSYGRCVHTKTYRWDEDWIVENESYYLHQGLHEIASMDRECHIKQLRIMGKREGLAFRSAIAIEIEDQIYAPIYNQRYDVIALLDMTTGEPVESYRYSAFGQFTVYDQNNEKISGTKIGNPWLFGNKRYDSLTDLFNFGTRYYRSSLGRWMTPDAGGFIDGFNLYAYTHNHPLTCSDFFGFSTSNTIKQNNQSYLDATTHWFKQQCSVMTESAIKATNYTVDKCLIASSYIGECVENGAHHLIPSSSIQYCFEGIGRKMQGKSYEHQYSGDVWCESGSVGDKDFSNCLVRYISGYLCSKEVTENSAKMISEMLGGHRVYYTSHQSRGFMSDNLSVAMGIIGIEHYSIKYLKSNIIEDYDKMKQQCGDDFKLYYYTHSRGAYDFYMATRDLPDEMKKKMQVVTLAGAVKLSNIEFGKAKNFENSNDFIKPISRLLTANLKDCQITQTNFTNGGWQSPLTDHFLDSEGYVRVLKDLNTDILGMEIR